MHIGPTKFLKDGAATANYDLEGRLFGGSKGWDWGDNKEIEEILAIAKDN